MSRNREFDECIFDVTTFDNSRYPGGLHWSNDGLIGLMNGQSIQIFNVSFNHMSCYTSKWLKLNHLSNQPATCKVAPMALDGNILSWLDGSSSQLDITITAIDWSPPGLTWDSSSLLAVLLSNGTVFIVQTDTDETTTIPLMNSSYELEFRGLRALSHFSKYVPGQIKAISWYLQATTDSANITKNCILGVGCQHTVSLWSVISKSSDSAIPEVSPGEYLNFQLLGSLVVPTSEVSSVSCIFQSSVEFTGNIFFMVVGTVDGELFLIQFQPQATLLPSSSTVMTGEIIWKKQPFPTITPVHMLFSHYTDILAVASNSIALCSLITNPASELTTAMPVCRRLHTQTITGLSLLTPPPPLCHLPQIESPVINWPLFATSSLDSTIKCWGEMTGFNSEDNTSPNQIPELECKLVLDINSSTPHYGICSDPTGMVLCAQRVVYGQVIQTRSAQALRELYKNRSKITFIPSPVLPKNWVLDHTCCTETLWRLSAHMNPSISLSGLALAVLHAIERLSMKVFEDIPPKITKLSGSSVSGIWGRNTASLGLDSTEGRDEEQQRGKEINDSDAEDEEEGQSEAKGTPSLKGRGKSRSSRPQAHRGGGAADIGALLAAQRLPFLRARVERVLAVLVAAGSAVADLLDPAALMPCHETSMAAMEEDSSLASGINIFLISTNPNILVCKIRLWTCLHLVTMACFATLGQELSEAAESLVTQLRTSICIGNTILVLTRASTDAVTSLTKADVRTLRMKVAVLRHVSPGMTTVLWNELRALCETVETKIASTKNLCNDIPSILSEICPVCDREEQLLQLGLCHAYSSQGGYCCDCHVLCRRCEVTCQLVGPLDDVLRCTLCGAVQKTDRVNVSSQSSRRSSDGVLSTWLHNRNNLCPYCSLIMTPL